MYYTIIKLYWSCAATSFVAGTVTQSPPHIMIRSHKREHFVYMYVHDWSLLKLIYPGNSKNSSLNKSAVNFFMCLDNFVLYVSYLNLFFVFTFFRVSFYILIVITYVYFVCCNLSFVIYLITCLLIYIFYN